MELLTILENFGGDALQTVIILFLLWQKLTISEKVATDNRDALTRIETILEERQKK
jgi:hypothetical protein